MTNPNNGLSLGVKTPNINLMEPPVNVKIPQLSGTFVLGETITADAGDWEQNDLTFTYQFNSEAEGSSNEYELQEGDEETGVYVTVRGTNRLGTVEAVSKTETVETLTNLTLPTISGVFEVGEEVTADPGTWNLPNSSLEFTFSFNGETASATETYTLLEADIATGIEVIVEATSNAESVEATSENYDVTAGV